MSPQVWRGVRAWAPVLLLLVLGAAASLLAARQVAANERNRGERLLAQRSADVAVQVEGEVQRYRDLAAAVAELIEVSPALTRESYDQYVRSLDLVHRYPGAAYVAFIVPVDDAGLPALEGHVGAGRPEVDPGGARGDDPRHLIRTAGLGADGRPLTLGLDLSAAPQPTAAMLRARDSGTTELSQAYVLLDDRGLPQAQQQQSFVLAAPVFRQSPPPGTEAGRRAGLRGWVVVGFRGGDFLGELLAVSGRGLMVELRDDDSGAAGEQPVVALLDDGEVATGGGIQEPAALTRTRLLDVGRTWALRTAARPELLADVTSAAPALTLAGGLVLDLLLVAIAGLLVSQRQRALGLVNTITGSLERANADLAARNEFTETLLETVDVAVSACDEQARLTYRNRRSRELHGLGSEGDVPPERWAERYRLLRADGRTPLPPGEVPLLRVLHEGAVQGAEIVVAPVDGPPHTLLINGRTLTREDGTVMGAVSAGHDVTALREGERALRDSEKRFRSAFAHGLVGMALADGQGRFLEVNAALCELFGLRQQQLLGRRTRDLVHPEDRGPDEELARSVTAGHGVHQAERRFRTAEGATLSCLISADPVPGPAGARYVFYQIADITERKDKEERLTYRALHDPLTGLPNRALLMDRLGNAMARHQRRRHTVAVLFCDLDGFKDVNDSLGHEAGDAVLVEVGRRLSATVRASDTVARLGGDEFVVLLEDLRDGEAQLVGGRIEQAIAEPIAYEEQAVTVTVSAGMVYVDQRHRTPWDVLREADAAMYRAKALGKRRMEVFAADLRVVSDDR